MSCIFQHCLLLSASAECLLPEQTAGAVPSKQHIQTDGVSHHVISCIFQHCKPACLTDFAAWCRCVHKLQSKGLKVLCDIVINHRCAQKQDKNGIWNVFGGKMAWDAKAIVVNDRKFKGKGNRATGDEFAAAPNIDHMQDYVRKDLTEWLEWLRDDIGFDGWR